MSVPKDKIPAVAYYRYSPGGGQTEQSIEGQRRDCERYAKAHGFVIVKEYVDRHLTGKNSRRPSFQAMIADAEEHKFSVLIAWKNDRIARNLRDSLYYKDRLRTAGVSIYYAEMDIPKGPEGILMESLMDGLAEYYSAELAQKVRRGVLESAHKCQALGGVPPFGLAKKNKKYVPDPAQAQTVRWIYQQYAAGVQIRQICDKLNAQGIRNARGNEWTKSSLRTILTNEKYVGVYDSHGVRVEDAIEPILDRDLFDRVQLLVKQNYHQGTRARAAGIVAPYHLSGVAYCALCGAALMGVSGTGRHGKKFYYYACGAHCRHEGCDKKPMPKAWLEEQVITATADYVLKPSRLRRIAKQAEQISAQDNSTQAELAVAKAALQDTRRRISNILSAMEEGRYSKTAAERLSILERSAENEERRIQSLSRAKPKVTASRVEFFLHKLLQEPDESADKYLQRLLQVFIRRIDVTETALIIYYSIDNKQAAPLGTAYSLAPPQKQTYQQDKSVFDCSAVKWTVQDSNL